MPFTYNIPLLLTEVFGLRGRYAIPADQPSSQVISYPEVVVMELAEDTAMSVLGTPVFDRIEIESGVIDGTGEAYEGFIFPDTVLIDVSRPKHLVETAVAGRDGTVKELVAMGDYSIRIRGVLVNHEGNDPPFELVREIRRIFDVPAAVRAQSRLFELLHIDQVVMKNLELPARENFINVQPFVIDAVSDTAAELKIRQGL